MSFGPSDGDVVIFCTHVEASEARILLPGNMHWWKTGGSVELLGQELTVEWMAMCEECHIRFVKSNRAEFVGQHARWIGERPDIKAIN